MKRCSHPHLLQLHEVYADPESEDGSIRVHLITDLFEDGSLENFVQKQAVGEVNAWLVIKQIASALQCLNQTMVTAPLPNTHMMSEQTRILGKQIQS